ncbi:DUF6085 family protein [Streptomyces sp. NPDC059447]|uniref:DUF6085 family protein n=1 Tax=Streptomyces sp. NPDC059447 TaxID=3346834 RepID=UPI0036CC101C
MTSPFDSLSPRARQLMEDFDIFALAEIAASGSANPSVQGRCPACHGQSLFLGEGGYVTCARIDCPDPEAATRILEQRIDYTKIREIAVEGAGTWYPTCPEGQHIEHPGYTCEDADRMAAVGQKFMKDAARLIDAMTADVPAALRGPNWKGRP